jgi:hypothetical protein
VLSAVTVSSSLTQARRRWRRPGPRYTVKKP